MNEHLPECPVWRCCKPDEKATMHTCICPYDERIVGLITRQRAEQIGRNIGQHGCVITEQRHLPECPMLEPFSAERKQHCFCTRKNPCIHDEMECICERLSACEKRVHEIAYQQGLGAGSDEHGQHEIGWMKGYDAALDDAREAVARQQRHFHGWDYSCIDPENALATIDALKEGSND